MEDGDSCRVVLIVRGREGVVITEGVVRLLEENGVYVLRAYR